MLGTPSAIIICAQTVLKFYEKHPLSCALVAAFIIRTISAFSNYGPFAYDDYQNVIDPALRHLMLGSRPDIPALRFDILPYAFSWFMKPLFLFGVKRADLLVGFAYWVMGVISLVQIIAIHRIGALILTTRWQNAMTLFAATWAIAPIFTNSADIAGPAYILMTFAILHLLRDTTRSILRAGFFLSAAIFFRFSLAPLYFGLAVWILVVKNRGEKIRQLTLFAGGGAITAAIMVLFELASHKLPFSTALEFIKYNYTEHIAAQNYGSMPWFSYALLTIAFPLPLVNLGFLPGMARALRRFSGLAVLLGVFLLSHSAVAFKLERYVIPILPILTIIFFVALQEAGNQRWARYSWRLILLINLFCIVPVAVTMQQRAGVDGTIYAGKLVGTRFVHKIDPWRVGYYGFKSDTALFTSSTGEIIQRAGEAKIEKFWVFRFLYFPKKDLADLETAGFACTYVRNFRPDFLERLAIKLNPEMNSRRDDTSLYACTRAIK